MVNKYDKVKSLMNIWCSVWRDPSTAQNRDAVKFSHSWKKYKIIFLFQFSFRYTKLIPLNTQPFGLIKFGHIDYLPQFHFSINFNPMIFILFLYTKQYVRYILCHQKHQNDRKSICPITCMILFVGNIFSKNKKYN